MKKIILTANAPEPIGPYSQAVQIGDFIYVSGQIAIDPSLGALVQNTIESETLRVMENIKAIVEAGGADMSKIVKASIFVTDMELFGQVNEIYGAFFTAPFPARETVAVANLPKGARVEISAIAYVG